MKKRYLIPVLLVILVVVGILGVSCDNSSRLTRDEQEQKILELQRQNEELRGQLDALSAAVEELKKEQSKPSYQPPLGQNSSSQDNWDFWDAYDYKQDKARKEMDDAIDFALGR